MKALVVEDEIIIAFSLVDMIEAAGHEVIGFCRSLEQAVELTRDNPPDFAFVDLRLGEGRWGGAVDRYLTDSFGTTCIYVTANPDFAQRYRTGAIGYVEKPVDPREVGELIDFIADLRAGRSPRRRPRRLRLFGDSLAQADRNQGDDAGGANKFEVAFERSREAVIR